MRQIIRVLSFLIISAVSIHGVVLIPGSQYLYTGFGAQEMSLAYTGISGLGSIDGNAFNPASMADARRIANSLFVGGLGSANFLLSPALVLPTDWGVLSVNALYLNGSLSNTLNNLLGAQVSLAKPITENLFWGFALKFGYSWVNPSPSDWQLGLDTGLILNLKIGGEGAGLFDPSFGVVLKNIGKTVSLPPYDPFPAMGIGLGASVSPVRVGWYELRTSADILFPWNPLNLVFSVGAENRFFNLIQLRFGYTLNTTNFGIPLVGFFSLGAGLTGRITFREPTEIGISYSLQNQSFNGANEWAHAVTVSVAWGFYDDVKPEAHLTPHHLYFSPNFDGSQDEDRLELSVRDNTLVDGWEVEIRDPSGKTVKTFRSVEKPQLRTLTLEKFFRQIFSRKQSVEIPKEVAWNGQDETGKQLPDGQYSYILRAWDENKNTNVTEPGRIIIDTVVPKVAVRPDYTLFSPNGDGAKDTVAFSIRSSDVRDVNRIKAFIKDSRNAVVRSYDFSNVMPSEIVWDGRDDSGKPVPEGDYALFLFVENPAGNNVQNQVGGIRLVTNYQTVQMDVRNANMARFSPTAPGANNSLTFTPRISDTAGLDKWTFRVTDERGKTVREFTGVSAPQDIVWDGRDAAGRVVPDGTYGAVLELLFDSGNHPQSPPVTVGIDTKPPQLSVKPEYHSFSPNGDGRQDTLTFAQSARGETNDMIEARVMDAAGNVIYYGRYPLSEFPASFTWTGLDKNLKPLPEGRYTYILDGSDDVGNRSAVSAGDLFLKTGLEKVSVQCDVPAFAPGNTNAVPRAVFTPSVTARDGIVSFVFTVSDSANRPVRTLTTNTFLVRIDWDGRDDSGRTVKDGNYSYAIHVKYSFGDEPVSASRTVRVKSAGPVITVSNETVFSPNGDGRSETLLVSQSVANTDPGDAVEAVMTGPDGKTVRSFRWTGQPPEDIVWDGLDDNGRPVPQGIYSYRVTVTDVARDRSSAVSSPIRLVRETGSVKLKIDPLAFSPNGDGILDSCAITLEASSPDGIVSTELLIADSADRIIRRFVFTNSAPETVPWNGLDQDGKSVPDGYFGAAVQAEWNSGNVAQAFVSNILLVKDPPRYKLIISPALFTPDGDGDNDNCVINLDISSPAPLTNWSLSIRKKPEGTNLGPVFRSYSGTSPVKKMFVWDGRSDDGQDMVESVQDYVVTLEASDSLGNRLTNIRRTIPVGVLVEKTPDGLRIRVSSVQFDFDSAVLRRESRDVLDKVIAIIRKILSDPKKYGITPDYRIEVSGHTDDVGTEEYNQKLSERRAQSVFNYLVEKDVDPKILSAAGYGMTRPYKVIQSGMEKEKIEEYRARNRRVEFFIRK